MLNVNELSGFGAGGDAAHQYWRLYIRHSNAGGSDQVRNLSELSLKGVSGGSNLATGGTPFVGSDYPGATVADVMGALADVFNSTLTAGYTFQNMVGGSASPGTPNHIGYQFATPVKIVEFDVSIATQFMVTPNCAPTDFELQWSDDGTTYTRAGSAVLESSWTTASPQTKTYSAL